VAPHFIRKVSQVPPLFARNCPALWRRDATVSGAAICRRGAVRRCREERTASLDTLSAAVNSGDPSVTPQLTAAAMLDHARRIYGAPRGDIIAAAYPRSGSL
jgi:hypothetical protein